MKVKEFWEEHKDKIVTAAIVGGTIANCVVWYKVGRRCEFNHWAKKFHGGFWNIMLSSLNSDAGLYCRRLIGKDTVVKFKDLGELAKEAVAWEGSKEHLEDVVNGLYVFTGKAK